MIWLCKSDGASLTQVAHDNPNWRTRTPHSKSRKYINCLYPKIKIENMMWREETIRGQTVSVGV